MHCPNPMEDYEGYVLWCELHQCDLCEGTGELSGDYDGEERTCGRCDGTGIDPEKCDSPEIE